MGSRRDNGAGISIHAAREGGDINPRMPNAKAYISIHAAREGGDFDKLFHRRILLISIHAAREGGDAEASSTIQGSLSFQSTPPVKAATVAGIQGCYSSLISIHAAREGGDARRCSTAYPQGYFNPRRP